MNHYHVKYFVDAVANKSVAESARINNVTHPAVSQAFRTLENELNVKLTSRKKRRFELTHEGEVFYQRAVDWLEQFENIKNEVTFGGKEVSGELLLGASQSLTAEFVGPIIFAMKKKHPRLQIRATFGEAAIIRDMVHRKSVQIGFVIDDDKLSDFEQKLICNGDFVVVSARPREKLSQKDLIVTYKSKVEVQDLFKKLKNKGYKEPNVFLELVSWSLIRRFVLDGDIHGYVPQYVVQEDLDKETLYKVELPVKPFRYSVKAIWRKRTTLSAGAKVFLDTLMESED